jgi:hypothetical protein
LILAGTHVILQAKAAQRKAALAAGRDLNAALNGVGDSGGDKGKEEEEEKKPAGIKVCLHMKHCTRVYLNSVNPRCAF